MRKATIHGYCDRLSVAPGERIEFKVSCEEAGTLPCRRRAARSRRHESGGAGLQGRGRRVGRERRLRRAAPTDGRRLLHRRRGRRRAGARRCLHAPRLRHADHAREARSGDHGPLRDRLASGLRAHDRGRRSGAHGSGARRSRRASRSIPRAGIPSRPRTTAPARSRCTRARSSTRPTACSARSCRFQARLAAPTPSRRHPATPAPRSRSPAWHASPGARGSTRT